MNLCLTYSLHFDTALMYHIDTLYPVLYIKIPFILKLSPAVPSNVKRAPSHHALCCARVRMMKSCFILVIIVLSPNKSFNDRCSLYYYSCTNITFTQRNVCQGTEPNLGNKRNRGFATHPWNSVYVISSSLPSFTSSFQ